MEQFSFCVRYVDIDDITGVKILRSFFLKFVPVTDLTGEGLSNTVTNTCAELKLNLKRAVGQGYDRASAMSGELQGCAARITAHFPEVLYIHCISQSLNLAISDAYKIPIIRNSIGTINEIIKFF